MNKFAAFFLAASMAGSVFSQLPTPDVVLETGTITGQNTFVPASWDGFGSLLHPGQANSGDGVFFGDYYWIAVPTISGESNDNTITLYPVSGTGEATSDMPTQVGVVPMNPDSNGNTLFTPYTRVELVSWGEQLWVISFLPGSAEVQFAPLSLNKDYDPDNPRDHWYFVANPSESSNFIVTGGLPINGLSAELIDGKLTIFTWHGNHLDGYSLGVTTSSEGDFFGRTHYISLEEELKYTGIFDTQVYIPNSSAALPGVTPGVPNVLIVAASENIGSNGGNHDLLLWSATLEELTTETEFPINEVPLLSRTGLFTEDPFTAYTLKLSEGAVDFQNGQLFGNPAITITIFGQVPEAPHFPWFIATAPLMTSFNPETDSSAIPEFTYPGGGYAPPDDPYMSVSLGVQPVPVLDGEGNPTGDVQNYAMFATAVNWGPADEPRLNYAFNFQAAKANYLEQQPVVVTETHELNEFDEDIQESIVGAWSLIGVIHGAPPVAFNGTTANQTSTTITWKEASSTTKEVDMKHTSTTSVSEQASGKGPFFNAKVESSQVFLHATNTETSRTTGLDVSQSTNISSVSPTSGGEVTNTGVLLYLAPEVHNQGYRAYSFRGNDLEQITYVTWIEKATLVEVAYDITSPDSPVSIQDVDEGRKLFTVGEGMAATPSQAFPNQWSTPPASSSGVSVFSVDSATVSSGIGHTFSVVYSSTTGSGTTKTKKQTIGGGASIQIGFGGDNNVSKDPWGFNIGASVDRETTKTFTLESETTATFNEAIVTTLDAVVVPSPIPSNSYSSMTITPYLLFPSEPGAGDWIPRGKSTQRPFLITWSAAAAPIPPPTDGRTYTEFWGASFPATEDPDTIYVPFMQRWLYNAHYPWVFDFPNQEWRFFPRLLDPGGGMTIYGLREGWIWTHPNVLPWFFRYADQAWVLDRTFL